MLREEARLVVIVSFHIDGEGNDPGSAPFWICREEGGDGTLTPCFARNRNWPCISSRLDDP